MPDNKKVEIQNTALNRNLLTGRLIGSYAGSDSGPVIILLCGIHGNENAGVFAAYDIIARLEDEQPDFTGKVIALAGNLQALSVNRRYIDKDLNRIWSDDSLYKLQRGIRTQTDEISELADQEEIFGIIRSECIKAKGEVYIVDLHTTSAESTAFIFISDTMRNREFVKSIPLPVILGVEELLDSTLLNFANRLGVICFGLEAGSHESISSYENTINTLWVTIYKAGCLENVNWKKRVTNHHKSLRKCNGSIDGYFELVYRYAITGDEEFSMLPGFRNFQDVVEGQPLAESNNKKILCPQNGMILMPLYQKLGNDGFYIIKEINKLWIELSAVARKTGLDRILKYFPGIIQLRNNPERYAVKKKFAGRLIVRLFHLFGYQRSGQIHNFVLYSKRKFDMAPPENYKALFPGS